MPIQAPQWTEFLSCPVCCNEFAANLRPPISLGCGHTICRTCLATLHHRQCPFDQTVISTDLDYLPINNALLQLVSTPGSAAASAYGVKGGSAPGSGGNPVGNGGSTSPGGASSQGAVCGSSTSSTSSSSSSTSSSSSSASSSSSTSSGATGDATSTGAIDPDLNSTSVQSLAPENLQCYKTAKACIEELALYLKPCPASGGGGSLTGSAGGAGGPGASGPSGASLLSRQMQRKLVILVNCQLIEDEGRARSLRAARSLGERTVMELILHHQNPQQLSTNLWAAVRARGCQFLGPAMQEEVLKLVLLALEDGSALSRKVLVMFVVQRLEPHFSQASKTSIGHVVQLLYRASCFKVSKREGDSSLMQLKEEFRTYEALRREHDAQIVQIATEAGLRIAPDQWSSLLYGDTAHKSHMQSINDKLQTPQSFVQSVQELIIALQRTGDPANLSGLRVQLKHLAAIDWNSENHVPSWAECSAALQAVKRVVAGLVDFVQHHGNRKLQEAGHLAHNRNYKISLCRDLNNRGTCPRGPNCTFAHSEEELEKYRTKLRKNHGSSGGAGAGGGGGGGATSGLRMMPNGKDLPALGSTGPSGGSSRARSGLEYHHGGHPGGGSNGEGAGGAMHQSSSSSHGYHSSGEEPSSSPVRFQKNASVGGGREGTGGHRMMDKGHAGGQGGASGGGSNGSGSSHHGSFGPTSMNGGARGGGYGVGGGNVAGHYPHGSAGGSMSYPHPNRGPPGAGHQSSPQGMRYRPPQPISGSGNANGAGGYPPGGPGQGHPNLLHHGTGGNGAQGPAAYSQPLPATQPGAGAGAGTVPGGHSMEHHHHGLHPPFYGGEYAEGKHGSEHGPPHLSLHHGHNHPAQTRRAPSYAGWEGLGSPPQHHLTGGHHGAPGKAGPSNPGFGMTGGVQAHHSPYGAGGSPKNGHTSSASAPMGAKYMGAMAPPGGQPNFHHHKLGPGPQARDYKEKHPGNRSHLGPPHGHGGMPPGSGPVGPQYAPGRNGALHLPPPPYLSSPLPMTGPDGGPGKSPSGPVPPPPHHNGHNGSPGGYQHHPHHQQQHHMHHGPLSYQQQRPAIGETGGYLPKMLFDTFGPAGGKKSFNQQLMNQHLNDIAMANPGAAAAAAAAASKDMFIRSDSLLADDDALLVAEQEFSNGSVSRINPIGTERIDLGLVPRGHPRISGGPQQRGLWSASSSSLGDNPSPTGAGNGSSSASSPFYPGSNGNGNQPLIPGAIPQHHKHSAQQHQQQQQQPAQPPNLPYHSQHHASAVASSVMLGKMAPEPNNNTLDFDLLRAEKKALEYESAGGTMVDCCEPTPSSGGGNVDPDFLLQSLVSPSGIPGGHYGQQQQHQQQQHQQQQHHFPSMAAGSVMMMGDRSDSPHHTQQQQQQQHQLLAKTSQSDRCNGAGLKERLGSAGSALSPGCGNDDQRKLNDLKSPQSSLSGMQSPASVMIMSVTSESSACTTPPISAATGPTGGSSMWNNLLDLTSLKPSPLADSLSDPNDQQDGVCGANGRSNGGSAGYGMASSFIRASEQYKFPNMLIDAGAGPQHHPSGMLGQHSNGAGGVTSTGESLGDVGRFHEMLNVSQPASPSCLSDRAACDEQRKMGAFKELNDLRIHASSVAGLQTTPSAIITSVTASSTPSVVSSAGGSDGGGALHVDQSAASLWNNLLDLSSLKPTTLPTMAVGPTVVLDQPGANEPLGVGASSCNTSGTINTSNGSSCEDSYESGMVDDMRELELRLESVLQLDENGI